MNNLQIIEKLQSSTFTDEDGEQYTLDFQPALSDKEIENLKKQFPNSSIDKELLDILKYTKGWDGFGLERVYFDSIGEFGFWELSPYSITLGHDGFGNFWLLDIDKNGNLGKVFFACHDPAVFIVHSQNLNEYLMHLVEFYEKPESCHLNEVHDNTVMTVWDNNNLCVSKTDFLTKNTSFKGFLDEFEGDEWTVADLRNDKNGDGFAWGKFGSNQFTKRHGKELIWVIKNKKKGFFKRLFG
ncbi:SMI1/KNR4 family protein [Flavivirga spongiicola]|uniref:SMI1/KNR4 family protein n=1 Tax=Flavivirga spongiicola TaxID=421621 RepID=A0ABU7XTS6_9FLAO|nr:SMI1/KNR4 family protein [Flavivirga sp. MEBiC05379]MDO5979195.1 SMI1/KNR4 family protein [Flavivirga sp. MEBiC05379]